MLSSLEPSHASSLPHPSAAMFGKINLRGWRKKCRGLELQEIERFFFLEWQRYICFLPQRQTVRTKVSVCGRDPGNFRNVAGRCEDDCLIWWRTHPLAEPSDNAPSEEFRLLRSQSFASRLRICRQGRTITENLQRCKHWCAKLRAHSKQRHWQIQVIGLTFYNTWGIKD